MMMEEVGRDERSKPSDDIDGAEHFEDVELQSSSRRSSGGSQVATTQLKSVLKKGERVKVLSEEDLEKRKYYEIEFDVDDAMWKELIRVVAMLRSEDDDENLDGCNILHGWLLDADQFSHYFDAIIQRTAHSVKLLESHPDSQVVEAAQKCFQLMSETSIHLDSLLQDEESRLDLIFNDWDGNMTNVEHMEYQRVLDKQKKKLSRPSPFQIRTVAIISFVLGVGLLGSLTMAIYSVVIHFSLSVTQESCLALEYTGLAVLLWNAVVIHAMRFGLFFFPPKDTRGIDEEWVEAVFKRQSLRSIVVSAVSLFYINRYLGLYLTRGLVLGDNCTDTMFSRSGGSIVVFGFDAAIICSLLFAWTPLRSSLMNPICCKRVYVLSLTRTLRFGALGLTCFKPLFKDRESIRSYLKAYPEAVSDRAAKIQTRKRHGRGIGSEAFDDGDENFEHSAHCSWNKCYLKMRQDKFDASVEEYVTLDNILKQRMEKKSKQIVEFSRARRRK